jgi:dihydroorotase
MAKMNPPLRKEEDRLAIIKGIADGTIETIATDHAPHTLQEKQQEFKEAPSGIIGLETSLGLGIRELVHKGYMDMSTLLSRMTVEPARIYGLDAGKIQVGGDADLVIFNEEETKCYDSFKSKAENTPFKGENIPGKVHYTICRGEVVYEA